ncbi:topological determinant of cell division [Carnobacterium maltaromaticum]|uniref:topological determinant of cell division n=1 Tax=Carnobacterium maltaromaticum TaxID=2751 RepID=UPI0039BDB2A7
MNYLDSVAGIIFKAIILFFAQPLFWLGALVALLSSILRIKRERKIYRVAIHKGFNEVRNYLISGLLPGLIISAIVILLGITINIEWLWVYPIVVAFCFILLGYRFIHPMFTIPITIGILFITSYLIKADSGFSVGMLDFNMDFINTGLVQNSLILTILLILATYFLFKQALKYLSPNFRKTSRGKWIASYLVKPLTFLPLFLLVPGQQFTELFSWWPIFSIGNETYTLVAIPVLIGLRIKIETQPLKVAIKGIQKDIVLVSIVGIVGTVLSYYVYYAAEVTLLLIFIGGVATLIRHNIREKKWQFLYGPVGDGIKIVGIRPDTPATKMQLEIGETIVVCNNQAVKNDDEFYQALLINSAYCHLKIRGLDGEYRLTETAIFADSPHELGIVTIPDKIN